MASIKEVKRRLEEFKTLKPNPDYWNGKSCDVQGLSWLQGEVESLEQSGFNRLEVFPAREEDTVIFKFQVEGHDVEVYVNVKTKFMNAFIHVGKKVLNLDNTTDEDKELVVFFTQAMLFLWMYKDGVLDENLVWLGE